MPLGQQNTIGQSQSFNQLLQEHPEWRQVAIVSSGFHLPRVARTVGNNSPQAKQRNGQLNALGRLEAISLFAIDRRNCNEGVADFDLKREPDAMYNYSTGFGGIKEPTIAKTVARNVILHPERQRTNAVRRFWCERVSSPLTSIKDHENLLH